MEIRLVNPYPSFSEVEVELEKRFGLQKAIVVYTSFRSDDLTRRSIGRAAARYLESATRGNEILGIGWGRTVYETLNYVNRRMPLTVVPLIGAVGQISPRFQVNEFASRFAEKIGATFVPLYAPALVDSGKIAQTLRQDQSIARVMKLWETLGVALIGMGDPRRKEAFVPQFFYNDPVSSAILKSEEVVGDVLYHFLKRDGSLCDSLFDRRIIGITLEQLRKVPLVIGVTDASWKKDILHAVLEGQYLDVLVTDLETAQMLLGEEKT